MSSWEWLLAVLVGLLIAPIPVVLVLEMVLGESWGVQRAVALVARFPAAFAIGVVVLVSEVVALCVACAWMRREVLRMRSEHNATKAEAPERASS